MLENIPEKLEFTALENIALARVQPFGMHLFEFIFYILLALLCLLAFRSFIKSMALVVLKPRKEDFLTQVTNSEFVQGECASCGWKGMVPLYRKRCPKCSSTTFA